MKFNDKEPLINERKQNSFCRPRLLQLFFGIAVFLVLCLFHWSYTVRNENFRLESQLSRMRAIIRNLTIKFNREKTVWERQLQECTKHSLEFKTSNAVQLEQCRQQMTQQVVDKENEINAKLRECDNQMNQLKEELKNKRGPGSKVEIQTLKIADDLQGLRVQDKAITDLSTTNILKEKLIPIPPPPGREFKNLTASRDGNDNMAGNVGRSITQNINLPKDANINADEGRFRGAVPKSTPATPGSDKGMNQTRGNRNKITGSGDVYNSKKLVNDYDAGFAANKKLGQKSASEKPRDKSLIDMADYDDYGNDKDDKAPNGSPKDSPNGIPPTGKKTGTSRSPVDGAPAGKMSRDQWHRRQQGSNSKRELQRH